MRFDEIELEAVPLGVEEAVAEVADVEGDDAPRGKRLLALLTDLSLFAALTLALLPLLPATFSPIPVAALGGFVVVMSFYYFVGSWLLWGKTIGGAIFDVKVVPAAGDAMSLQDATLRWVGVYASLLLAGLGFAVAVLPSRLSVPDRMSGTRCIRG